SRLTENGFEEVSRLPPGVGPFQEHFPAFGGDAVIPPRRSEFRRDALGFQQTLPSQRTQHGVSCPGLHRQRPACSLLKQPSQFIAVRRPPCPLHCRQHRKRSNPCIEFLAKFKRTFMLHLAPLHPGGTNNLTIAEPLRYCQLNSSKFENS